jgi:hypothetical protein
MFRRNNEERSRNHYCRGKALSITYSECVSMALLNQEMQTPVPYYLAPRETCLAVPYFPTLFHKRNDFRGARYGWGRGVVYSLQSLSETFLILRRILPDIKIALSTSSRKVPSRGILAHWKTFPPIVGKQASHL